jgi:excinuclease UvrABC nuclease subunit
MTAQMHAVAKQMDFETAAKLRDKIVEIQSILD